MVRTEPSQGLNTGSTPVSATKFSYTYALWSLVPFQKHKAPESIAQGIANHPVSSPAKAVMQK